MPIIPNASNDELSSPYFRLNKDVCEEFEGFILSQNGQISGKYNAFSYHVNGTLEHPKSEITIKKSSYTTQGNLFLREDNGLLVRSEWRIHLQKQPLKIKIKRRWGRLKLNKKKVNSPFFKEILSMLENYLNDIYCIILIEEELIIEWRCEELYLNKFAEIRQYIFQNGL